MRIPLRLVALLALLAASACSSTPVLYRWGAYEPLLYQMYTQGDGSDPFEQTALLREDIDRTQAEGKRVPPGVHAHLGFLYYSQGDKSAAREEFLKERELFPESSVFINGILKRMKRGS